MFAHSYAVEIEHILRNIFKCDRGGFAGIIDADFIESHPYTAISSGLAFLYAFADLNRKAKIEKYIADYGYYLKFSLNELLSFETSTKQFDNYSVELEFENGEKALEKIIEALRTTCG